MALCAFFTVGHTPQDTVSLLQPDVFESERPYDKPGANRMVDMPGVVTSGFDAKVPVGTSGFTMADAAKTTSSTFTGEKPVVSVRRDADRDTLVINGRDVGTAPPRGVWGTSGAMMTPVKAVDGRDVPQPRFEGDGLDSTWEERPPKEPWHWMPPWVKESWNGGDEPHRETGYREMVYAPETFGRGVANEHTRHHVQLEGQHQLGAALRAPR